MWRKAAELTWWQLHLPPVLHLYGYYSLLKCIVSHLSWYMGAPTYLGAEPRFLLTKELNYTKLSQFCHLNSECDEWWKASPWYQWLGKSPSISLCKSPSWPQRRKEAIKSMWHFIGYGRHSLFLRWMGTLLGAMLDLELPFSASVWNGNGGLC